MVVAENKLTEFIYNKIVIHGILRPILGSLLLKYSIHVISEAIHGILGAIHGISVGRHVIPSQCITES
jgi:hypothetical protein